MKNILITGGAGFIGSKIALKLVNKGYNVRVFDNLSQQVHGENAILPEELNGKVDFVKGDVKNVDDWKIALDKQDAVIHLAAETGTGQSMYNVYHYCNSNIGGTANLMDLLTNGKHSIKRVIVASSRAIYGEGSYYCKDHGVVFPEQRSEADLSIGDFDVKCPFCHGVGQVISTNETATIHPTSIYGITKQVEEQLVLVTCKALGIPSLIYRYQNVYGPGQSLSNPYTGILSIFSTRIKNGRDINIFEDGKESRDFVYVDDVADATISGLEKEELAHEIFNIGSGIMTSVSQVVNELLISYKKEVIVNITGNYRIGDIRHNYADISKAKVLLDYDPKVNFKTGIKKFVNWVEIQNEKIDNYEQSLSEMRVLGLLK